MEKLISLYSKIREGLSHVVFPDVCLCCGEEPLRAGRYICTFCLHRRFEDANPENNRSCGQVLLPDGVILQHALWQFDKGGVLQDLMHNLKYERLTGVGSQLGRVLGRRVQSHPIIHSALMEGDCVQVPVPLHYVKFRKRGFNQAFFISRGIETVLDIPICTVDAVVRKKFTRSQTGFTLEKRIENVRDAFKVRKTDQIAGKTVIIVDDVFTTGATSFELAKSLKKAGAESIMIWTIAQA